MNFKPIFYVNGILLLILSTAMIIPMCIDLAQANPNWRVFAGSQIITTFIAFLLIFSNREKSFNMTLRETFLMTCISWISMAAFGAIPFCLANISMSFTNGFFESMSGLTTTGATVMSGLDTMPMGILMWRSILQWLGGIGFLIIALAILPLLQISGMQIFKTQSFNIEKVLPSASQIANYICLIYIGLTILCAVLLTTAGMTLFEAVCHAMTAMATGGFSTSDASIGHFNSPLIEVILICFMVLAALPFALYLRSMRGDFSSILKDTQVRTFLKTIIACTLLITVYLLFNTPYGFFAALRHAAFAVVSLITTTGYGTQDYTLWGPFAIGMAFLITFIGGCSGSTSGGVKIFRFQILYAMMRSQINKLIVPNGIFQVNYNNKPVENDVLNAVGVFVFLYVSIVIIAGSVLMLTGLDFVTAYSGALTALSVVGPGLGSVIGPAGNFSTLPAAAVWVLSLCMLLGRLEILTVLVLFSPRFWKK